MNTSRIYAAYCKQEDIREQSSSGGIFSLIAEYVIGKGGLVCGAVFDDNKAVVHECISDLKDIKKLRGSKYVWSKIDKGTYQFIKEKLQEGRIVLFCGTPCQTEGVIRYVGEELRGNLIAVDFTCHGAPLPKVWNAYLAELSRNGDIESINMRDKHFGWKTYSFSVKFKNGSKFSQIFTWNHYSQAFLLNYSLRKPCYNCPFKGIPPKSDITLGDYWDVDKRHSKINDDKGISKLYVHTNKGQHIISEIASQLFLELDEEIPNFKTKKTVLKIPSKREAFLKLVDTEGFEAAYRKTIYKGLLWNLRWCIKGYVKIILHYLK